jgi:trimeric autotransporter adhesin
MGLAALVTLSSLALGSSIAAQCTQWSAFGSGTNNTILGLAAASNGDLYAGGAFLFAGGSSAVRVARWNGASWSALGTGVDATVRGLATLPNGDVIVAGDFANAGGAAANRIARWDGTAWSPLGAGVSSPGGLFGLYAVAAMPNGDVVAGGYFAQAGGVPANAIARWDGSTWSPLGGGIPTTVFALLPLSNGDLIVGGNFTTAGGVSARGVARWNGTAWSAFGSGITGFRVNALAVLPNGDLVVGGAFTAAGGQPAANIARWNGSTWSPLGSGTDGDVLALTALPNGDVLAGGQFTTAGGTPAVGMARWNGSSWSAVGFTGSAQVYAVTARGESDRVVGGFFTSVGGVGATFVANYGSVCAATAAVTGAGCPSSGGSNDYTPQNLPWVGTTYTARATGLPSSSVTFAMTGFTPANTPLNTLLQPAPSACTVLVQPVSATLQLPVAGVVDTAITIPGWVGLVGLPLLQQLLVVELQPGTGAVVEGTVTNRITATIGAF